MDQEKYIELSERTEKKFPNGLVLNQMQAEILHAVMGLGTEALELVDALKKHLIYGKELDWANINEELGDLHWYEAIIQRYLQERGVTPADTRLVNVKKLAARYPDGYADVNALIRDLEAERAILEGGVEDGRKSV